MNKRLGPWSPVRDIVHAVQSGVASARTLAEQSLERSERVQGALNCFAQIDAEGSLRAASAIDQRRQAGERLGPLAGVPVAIKDCTPVRGLGNRFGSYAFADNVSSSDALIVERLRDADAVIIGKTTLSELASSSFCDSPLHGITRNPWNADRTPGGSSGGSAVAVATGCVAVGEGTDMGGSVRIPASCTGLLGLKPAFGRIPNDDQPSFVDDIQHHGVLTRTVDDLAIVLPHLCGPHAADPRTLIPPLPSLDRLGHIDSLRVAVSEDLGFFVIENEVRKRLGEVALKLSRAGANVSMVSVGWDRAIADGWVKHWHVFLSAFFGQAIDRVRDKVDPRLLDAVSKGRAHDATSHLALDLVRKRQWETLREIFEHHDVLISPTMTRPAVGVEEDDARYHVVTADGRKRGLDMTSVFNWVPWCPALSVPAGFSSDGLPIGIHVAARPHREDLALVAAAAIESVFPYTFPPGWTP